MAGPVNRWRGGGALGVAAGAAIVLSSCTAASEPDKVVPQPQACAEGYSGPLQPSEESEPIFVAENHSYYTSDEERLLSQPYLVVYADGTASGGEVAATQPERPQNFDALKPVSGGWIDPCTFEWFSEQLSAIAEAEYGSIVNVQDGGYSTFLVDAGADGDLIEVSVDQFGIESDGGSDPELSAEEYEARMHLHDVLDKIKRAINDRALLPDRVQVLKIDGWEDPENPAAWPGLADRDACEIVTGDETAMIRKHVREAALKRLELDEHDFPIQPDPEYFIDPDVPGAEPILVATIQLAPGIGDCDELDAHARSDNAGNS